MSHTTFAKEVFVNLKLLEANHDWKTFAGAVVDRAIEEIEGDHAFVRFSLIGMDRILLVKKLARACEDGRKNQEVRVLTRGIPTGSSVLHALRVSRTPGQLRIVWQAIIIDASHFSGDRHA